MNIRIRLLLDLMRMIPRTPYKLRKLRAILGHILCGGTISRRLFQSQCPYPLHAVLLATTRCNKKCPDCFYTRLVNKPNVKTELTLELVKEALDTKLFQSVCRAALVGGEPLLNTELLVMISFLKGRGVLTTITTNGLLLSAELLQSLRSAGLDWLNVSIYDDNHSRIAEAFNAAKAGAFPFERMALVYHSGSIDGYREAYRFASNAKAPNLIFNHLYIPGDARTDSERDAFANEYDALCEAIRAEGRLRLYAHPAYRSTHGTTPRCGQAMSLVSLAPDRTLGPCCHLPPGPAFGTLEEPSPVLRFKRNVFEQTCPSACERCYFLHGAVY